MLLHAAELEADVEADVEAEAEAEVVDSWGDGKAAKDEKSSGGAGRYAGDEEWCTGAAAEAAGCNARGENSRFPSPGPSCT